MVVDVSVDAHFFCSRVAHNVVGTPNAGVSKFNFTSGKTHRLRLINTSGTALYLFSIDNHELIVIGELVENLEQLWIPIANISANDFVPVEPYTTDVVTLAVGQRTDILVKAIGKSGDTYWMRTRTPVLCSLTKQPFALAAIYYDGADTTKRPKSKAPSNWVKPTLLNCNNVSALLTYTIISKLALQGIMYLS
jgi:hypothetical protein